MPLLLARRDTAVTEIMDGTDCDPRKVRNTYRQFRLINAAGSRFHHAYRHWLQPQMRAAPQRRYTLLDIGFGGGDLTLALARWAAADGFRLDVTGIEINPRALDYAATLAPPENVAFRHANAHELLTRGERFDFVVSNHLLHHLSDDEFLEMLETATRLSRHCVLMMDARRSDIAYALFAVLTVPFLRNSYHRHDGLASIRRAYTYTELQQAAPSGWTLKRLFPFRLALAYTHPTVENL